MADDSRIEELLDKWEDSRGLRQAISPEDLCRDAPELLDDVKRRIEELESIDERLSTPNDSLSRFTPSDLGHDPAVAVCWPEQFGRYRILGPLGKGGMGTVFLAHDTVLDRPVALKIPSHLRMGSEKLLERFYREARSAARFRHPNLCPVFDVGEIDGRHYLVMAYIEGQPLSQLLAEQGAFHESDAVSLVLRIARAVGEAHEHGIVHRDLKPTNIIVDARGEPVVIDFGVARRSAIDESRLTQTGAVLGTPAYMSPEQVDGHAAEVGPASDIYSLGVILYELLTGHLPFEGTPVRILRQIGIVEPQPPSSLAFGIDPKLDVICKRAMATQPADRFATMHEFAAALDGFLRSRSGSSEHFSESRMPTAILTRNGDMVARRPGQRRSRAIPLGIAVGVAAIIGAIGIASRSHLKDFPSGDGSKSPIRGAVPAPAGSIPRSRPAPQSLETFVNSVGMEFVRIEPGEFAMGSPDSDADARPDEKPRHEVQISRPFYIGRHEVTLGAFRTFVESAAYKTNAETDGNGSLGYDPPSNSFGGPNPIYTWKNPGWRQSDDHPVVNVSWNDAAAFCEWLSRQESRVYRLPTEAEWEYCCRAGTMSRFWPGNEFRSLHLRENIGDESAPKGDKTLDWNDRFPLTAPVGTFAANDFGLYDTHGNVAEWCLDSPRPFSSSRAIDPRGPGKEANRACRGGAWNSIAYHTRSSRRAEYLPDSRSPDVGFRVVCEF